MHHFMINLSQSIQRTINRKSREAIKVTIKVQNLKIIQENEGRSLKLDLAVYKIIIRIIIRRRIRIRIIISSQVSSRRWSPSRQSCLRCLSRLLLFSSQRASPFTFFLDLSICVLRWKQCVVWCCCCCCITRLRPADRRLHKEAAPPVYISSHLLIIREYVNM